MSAPSHSHFYYVDPGNGTKWDNCPYSLFEDGHDVVGYITPPEGYVLVGFKREPMTPPDKFYDSKIVAQYEKADSSINWKAILLGILIALLAIGGIVAVLHFMGFLGSKPTDEPAVKPNEVKSPSEVTVIADTTMSLDTSLIMGKDTLALDTMTETNVEQAMETTPTVSKECAQFQQAFWDLIHRQERQMDPYGKLFRDYKGKVECEEFDYLRIFILVSGPAFKEWSSKLARIPAEDIQTVNTISDLKAKLRKRK